MEPYTKSSYSCCVGMRWSLALVSGRGGSPRPRKYSPTAPGKSIRCPAIWSFPTSADAADPRGLLSCLPARLAHRRRSARPGPGGQRTTHHPAQRACAARVRRPPLMLARRQSQAETNTRTSENHRPDESRPPTRLFGRTSAQTLQARRATRPRPSLSC